MSVILLDRTGMKVFWGSIPRMPDTPHGGPNMWESIKKRVPGKAKEALMEVASCSVRRVS